MSLTPVSSSDKDIGGVPSVQSGYSAEMKRNGICMEERSVYNYKCVGRNPRRILDDGTRFRGTRISRFLMVELSSGELESTCAGAKESHSADIVDDR